MGNFYVPEIFVLPAFFQLQVDPCLGLPEGLPLGEGGGLRLGLEEGLVAANVPWNQILGHNSFQFLICHSEELAIFLGPGWRGNFTGGLGSSSTICDH